MLTIATDFHYNAVVTIMLYRYNVNRGEIIMGK